MAYFSEGTSMGASPRFSISEEPRYLQDAPVHNTCYRWRSVTLPNSMQCAQTVLNVICWCLVRSGGWEVNTGSAASTSEACP
eukprot:COSAG05_NODE_2489_length_2996_cov_3.985847_1_plen_82_part_00